MTELFLIAHKVRDLPAFDVACHMECPECHSDGSTQDGGYIKGCVECDGLGYWWIIPTSGHRAYPWWSDSLSNHRFYHEDEGGSNVGQWHTDIATQMPPSLPDHYPHRSAPTISLAEALGIKPATRPSAPIVRRF